MPAITLVQRIPNWEETSAAYMSVPSNGLDQQTEKRIAELSPVHKEVKRVIEDGIRAIDRIHKHGPHIELPPNEVTGLEAIVMLTGRPPLLIQDGSFFKPPESWKILEQHRKAIEGIFPSIGRIEVTGHPSFDWIGTGFLVAPDVLMTNRHVAVEFCEMGARRKWQFMANMTSRVDYIEEINATQPAEFAITKIIGVHDTMDLALFQVEMTSGAGKVAPKPLKLATKPPGNMQQRMVYVVGYPAWDGRRNDPLEMQRIFANIFNVKRLQPGFVTRWDQASRILSHDCSTLGGNSGSCVVDLETHTVIGLHFGGRYLQSNSAIALWQLQQDPLLKNAKVNFI